MYAFLQVGDERCGRNYALSFEVPESTERPDRGPRGESLGSRGEAIAPVTPPAQGRIRSASPWPMGVTWRARPSFRDSPLGGHHPQLGDPALLAPSGVPLGIGHRRLAVPLGFRLGEAALLLSSARKGKRSGGSQLLGW